MNRQEKQAYLKENEGEAGEGVDCIIAQHVDCASSETGRHVVKAVFAQNGKLRHISCECNHEEGEAIRRLGGDSCFILRENLIKQHAGQDVPYDIQRKFPYALGNLPTMPYDVTRGRKDRRKRAEAEASKPKRKLRHVLTEKCVKIVLAAQDVSLYLDGGVECVKVGHTTLFRKKDGKWVAADTAERLFESDVFCRSGRSKRGYRYVQTCNLCNKKFNAAHYPTAAHRAAVSNALSDVVTVLNGYLNPAASKRVMARVKARNAKFGFTPIED